jgi:RNA polymerase sigma factor (sigma-70 family)
MAVDGTELLYEKYKALLFSLAYRMTGSVAEAEDVVQDVFLSWQKQPPERREHYEHPKAYLCRMTVNRCTDLAKSARSRRETYIGPWLPEPLVGVGNDPHVLVEQDETLSFGMLLLMERLTPIERAVFVLREAFAYEYGEIALMVERTEANVRKIMSRLRLKLEGELLPEQAADPKAAQELLTVFRLAAGTGNLEPFFAKLAPDVVLLSDGGGKVVAATVPIVSRERVALFLGGLMQKFAIAEPGSVAFVPTLVNGGPGLAVFDRNESDGVVSLLAFGMRSDGSISNIYIVRNPDKLRHVSSTLRIP